MQCSVFSLLLSRLYEGWNEISISRFFKLHSIPGPCSVLCSVVCSMMWQILSAAGRKKSEQEFEWEKNWARMGGGSGVEGSREPQTGSVGWSETWKENDDDDEMTTSGDDLCEQFDIFSLILFYAFICEMAAPFL